MSRPRFAASVGAAVVLLPAVAACGSTGETTSTVTAMTGANVVPCRSAVVPGEIPSWARAGFSDPHPRMAHALARHGRIAALVFGTALHVPPREEPTNKILWVAHPTPPLGAGDLRIRAQRMDGATPVGAPVTRTVEGGPGPSTVDLPHVGCWRLSLAWADTTDQVDLEYVAG